MNSSKLTDKINEYFVADVQDTNSVVSKYFDQTVINVLLTSLSKDQRLALYSLLEKGHITQAVDLVKQHIPDLDIKLVERIAHTWPKD